MYNQPYVTRGHVVYTGLEGRFPMAVVEEGFRYDQGEMLKPQP